MQVIVDQSLKPDDLAAIRDRLFAYNDDQVDGTEGHIGILLKDDAGNTVGGLTGHWYYSWLFVEFLFVPENLRGRDFGTELMQKAEAFARERAFTGIWLDTFSFQARGFYEKLGYTIFGEISDYPAGHARYFLTKRLQPRES